MINKINSQPEEIKEALFNAPIFMTLYAANQDGELKDYELEAAVDFIKVQTYNGPDILQEYFKKVEENFEEKIMEWNNELPLGKPNRDRRLVQLMAPVKLFMDSLSEKEELIFRRELIEFTILIDNSNRSVLESSILPLFSNFLHGRTKTKSNDIL